MKTTRECVCFAYFVDDLFIGWYSDSFGTIGKQPKIYGNSKEQLSTVKTNFDYKMQRINETSFSSELAKIPNDGKEHVEVLRLIIFQDEKALKGRNVELRMVVCPVYDGPNLDFDREAWKKVIEYQIELKRSLGIYDIPAGTMKRMQALQSFEKENPEPKYNGWIYADSALSASWAAIEPTKFVKVFKGTGFYNIEKIKNVESNEEAIETGDVTMLSSEEV